MMEIIASILAGILSITIGGLSLQGISSYSRRKKRRARTMVVTPGARIQESISKLSSASHEIDVIIQDIIDNIRNRQTMLEELTIKYGNLLQEEGELSKRVEMLKKIPLEVADHFRQISDESLEGAEKRRTKRDIIMLASGIALTTVIGVLLRAF